MKGTAPRAAAFAPEKGAAVRRAEALANGGRARLAAFATALGRTLLAMTVSAALCLGAVQGWELARRSPFFAVGGIAVRGAVHAAPEELIARSGLSPGQNLFRVDLALAARGVESSPWVVSASVSRRLPRALEIEVAEHQPAAVVALGRSYLVDAEGRVFKKAEPADERLALPRIEGLGRGDWEGNREEAQRRVLVALQLLDAWRREGLPPAQLQAVRFDEAGQATAVSREGERTQEVQLGAGPFGGKLLRLALVRAALQRRGEVASRIDLDNQARPDTVAAQIVQSE